jgi:hypothetical protein
MKIHENQKVAGTQAVTVCLLLVCTAASSAFGQTPPRRTCLPVSERAGRDVGAGS